MDTDSQLQRFLKRMAGTYIWWMTPGEAIKMPDAIIAQVMDIGDFHDTQKLIRIAGTARLKRVLRNALAGQFRPKSWSYWHIMLDMANHDTVPPMPKRRTSDDQKIYAALRCPLRRHRHNMERPYDHKKAGDGSIDSPKKRGE